MDLVPLHVQHGIVMVSELSEEELRRRYLDWCSAQVARRFLELSLDEVWLRSNRASSLPSTPPDSPDSLPIPAARIPNYLELVRRTTVQLAQEMDLPRFEVWREAYGKDPAPYDAEMLGDGGSS